MELSLSAVLSPLKTRKFWYELLLMTVAMFAVVAGVYYFLMPSKLIIGTLAGLAIVVDDLMAGIGVEIGVANWLNIMNILLLIAGFLTIGREFGVKTVYASLVQGPMINFFEKVYPYQNLLVEPGQVSVMNDPWFDLLCYVLLVGASQAILFRINGSSGGMDIVAKIINKYFHTDIGTAVAVGGFVVCATAFAINPFRMVVIGLIGTWLNGIVVDHFTATLNRKKRVCIISEENDRIRKFIVDRLVRGCTIYEVRGGYSGNRHEELQALLTKDEFAYVMDFIKSNNIQAFITAGNVSEVYGRWFKHNPSHYKNVNK